MRFGIATTLLLVGLAIATPTITQARSGKNNPIPKVGDDCWEWEWDDWEWEWDCRDRKSQAIATPQEDTEKNNPIPKVGDDCWEWEWDDWEWEWDCRDRKSQAKVYPREAEKNKQAKPKKVQFKVGPLDHPIVKDCTESCWESLDEVYEHCPDTFECASQYMTYGCQLCLCDEFDEYFECN